MANAIKIEYYKNERKVIVKPKDKIITDSLFASLVLNDIKVSKKENGIIFGDDEYNKFNMKLIDKAIRIVLEHKCYEKRILKSPSFDSLKRVSRIKNTFDEIVELKSIKLRVDNFIFGCDGASYSYRFIYIDNNNEFRLSTIGLDEQNSRIVNSFSYDSINHIDFESFKELREYLEDN